VLLAWEMIFGLSVKMFKFVVELIVTNVTDVFGFYFQINCVRISL